MLFIFHANSRSNLRCSKTSGFVHQHLTPSVKIDTKSCVKSFLFFHLHRESAKSQKHKRRNSKVIQCPQNPCIIKTLLIRICTRFSSVQVAAPLDGIFSSSALPLFSFCIIQRLILSFSWGNRKLLLPKKLTRNIREGDMGMRVRAMGALPDLIRSLKKEAHPKPAIAAVPETRHLSLRSDQSHRQRPQRPASVSTVLLQLSPISLSLSL
ncbi:hypothetical protein C1H46_019784 [Malus baccata]|uniref:Uncharacterized protein n=1 Tax=Malus baccata TaxID=106549 RepID=A0A540M7R6_MALBA|nr:hypothetical protein C1H46_019784 [Malus baccata]